MRSSNITYNAATSACEKNRELQQALDLFVRMLGVRVQRDTITYNAVISACEKTFVGSRPWCSSKECRMKVRSETLSLTMPPAVLVRKASNGSMFLELFERMLGRHVQQRTITYSAAISTCEKGEQRQQVLGIFERMQNEIVQKYTISYNAAIGACEKGKQ